jgi:hypothetical protein
MNLPLPSQIAQWQDPIVEELHQIRKDLMAQHKGHLSNYSAAAKAHALALGFEFAKTDQPRRLASESFQ